VDFGSFKSMVESWLAEGVANERDRKVFTMRLGLWKKEQPTLNECGLKMGMSRERVRQIVNMCVEQLEEEDHFAKLAPFWNACEQTLFAWGGVMSAEELSEKVAAEFKWKQKPEPRILRTFLLHFGFEGFGEQDVCLAEHPCLEAKKVREDLIKLIEETASMPVAKAASALWDRSKGACRAKAKKVRGFSEALVRYLIDTDEAVAEQVVYENGTVFTASQWDLERGFVASAVSAILDEAGRPMHFTEIADELSKRRGHKVTHRYAYNRIWLAEDVVPVGRGKFMHLKHMAPSPKLITDVEQWFFDHLNDEVKYVAAYGAFAVYRQRLEKVGMTTPESLYGWLKESGSKELAYPRFPHVCRAEHAQRRVPLRKVIEEFIDRNGGTVTWKQFEEYVVKKMHLRRYFLQYLMKNLPASVSSRIKD